MIAQIALTFLIGAVAYWLILYIAQIVLDLAYGFDIEWADNALQAAKATGVTVILILIVLAAALGIAAAWGVL